MTTDPCDVFSASDGFVPLVMNCKLSTSFMAARRASLAETFAGRSI